MKRFKIIYRSCNSQFDVLQNRSSLKWPNIHRKTPVLDSLFNKVTGLDTCNFIKKWLQQRCFLVNPVAAFMSTRKGRRGKHGTKEQGKIFKMKEEMKTFHNTTM